MKIVSTAPACNSGWWPAAKRAASTNLDGGPRAIDRQPEWSGRQTREAAVTWQADQPVAHQLRKVIDPRPRRLVAHALHCRPEAILAGESP
jgi:hypothetical protein